MWGTNLYAPPITTDLWIGIRNRLRVPEVEATLGTPAGTSRVYVEGEQNAAGEDVETAPWGRLVVVPVDPVSEPRWEPGVPMMLRFLVRAEVNSRARANYSHSFRLQRIMREAYRVLQNWGGPLASTEVMIAGAVRLETGWRPQPLDDREASGTFLLSAVYQVDACEAITAL